MLKTISTYLFIFLGIGVLYISTSKKMMEKISAVRNESDAWWGVSSSTNKGDLVGMAYLDYVDKFVSKRDYVFHKPVYDGDKEINLYLHGDSYTFKIPDTAFLALNRYEYAWVYNQHIQYELDSTKKNILILEHAERYITTFYSGLDLLKLVYDKQTGSGYDSIMSDMAMVEKTVLTATEGDGWLDKLFNKNINQNLEYNLFNYNGLYAPRYAKAWLNYSLFHRASGNVVVSENGNQLFINETIGRSKKTSSQYPISNDEYDGIVRNLNLLYNYYKAEGFDEVYLAMIPNPVTILQPDGYNMLIPKLQNDARLKIKCIDIYSQYKATDTKIYRPGDTHWNSYGQQLWIDAVNHQLQQWVSLEDSISVIAPAQ